MALQKILKITCGFLFIILGLNSVFADEKNNLNQEKVKNNSEYTGKKILSKEELRKETIKIKIKEILKERRKQLIRDKIKKIRPARIEKMLLENTKNSLASNNIEGRTFTYKVILKSPEKIQEENKEELELNSASEKKEYPNYLDISNNLKYKSIQEKSLSCELSATSDILSYFEEQKISEISVINNVEKSLYNQLPRTENGVKIWGNPNAGYVGYIDKLPNGKKATQSGMTGYGVLEKPIAKIYDKYSYKNKIITNKDYSINYSQRQHLSEILKTINEGNMVQLWADYCTTPKFEDTGKKNHCKFLKQDRKLTWFYKENGQLLKYEGLAGEHAFYLLGYKGGIENPTHIIVWDTMTGKHSYPIKEWIRKWNKMENKSIIIYKK